ncbi:unnamed protein product [Clavelina lepadiformis]|uniref:Uncharacterized protein n=1 Tax=Clavelina lepadiformis TaxID=159417 RepID=A0ABP0FS95_CLALP
MPNYCTPGHPYASQSIHVTTNPIYKSKDGKYDQHNDERLLSSTTRPKTSTQITSPRMAGSPLEVSPRSPRAKTAPPGYKTMPPLNKAQKLITIKYIQRTPWCRDMYRWFTPDPSNGVWLDNEKVDRYRHLALRERLPMQRIYHVEKGLIPNYSGYVPGQKFRYGNTWTRETVNANKIGIPRRWESTSIFQNRPIGA